MIEPTEMDEKDYRLGREAAEAVIKVLKHNCDYGIQGFIDGIATGHPTHQQQVVAGVLSLVVRIADGYSDLRNESANRACEILRDALIKEGYYIPEIELSGSGMDGYQVDQIVKAKRVRMPFI